MIGLNSGLGRGRFGRSCLPFPPIYHRPHPPLGVFETNYKMAASDGECCRSVRFYGKIRDCEQSN